MKSINIPISDKLTYTTYSKENELIDLEILIEITQANNIYNVKYHTLDKEEIGGVTVDNGITTSAYGFSRVNDYSGRSSQIKMKTSGWWGKWAECIGVSLNHMTDGTVEGSVFGLVCIVFGPECAAGLSIGCAVAVTW